MSQFISPNTNKRTDDYGGNLNKKASFAIDIIRILEAVLIDDDFILGYMIGANEPTLSEGLKLAAILEKEGVDIYSCFIKT